MSSRARKHSLWITLTTYFYRHGRSDIAASNIRYLASSMSYCLLFVGSLNAHVHAVALPKKPPYSSQLPTIPQACAVTTFLYEFDLLAWKSELWSITDAATGVVVSWQAFRGVDAGSRSSTTLGSISTGIIWWCVPRCILTGSSNPVLAAACYGRKCMVLVLKVCWQGVRGWGGGELDCACLRQRQERCKNR